MRFSLITRYSSSELGTKSSSRLFPLFNVYCGGSGVAKLGLLPVAPEDAGGAAGAEDPVSDWYPAPGLDPDDAELPDDAEPPDEDEDEEEEEDPLPPHPDKAMISRRLKNTIAIFFACFFMRISPFIGFVNINPIKSKNITHTRIRKSILNDFPAYFD